MFEIESCRLRLCCAHAFNHCNYAYLKIKKVCRPVLFLRTCTSTRFHSLSETKPELLEKEVERHLHLLSFSFLLLCFCGSLFLAIVFWMCLFFVLPHFHLESPRCLVEVGLDRSLPLLRIWAVLGLVSLLLWLWLVASGFRLLRVYELRLSEFQ